MKKDPFQYIFRFCCDPGFNDAEEIPALLRYVDEADIDDVAVFANVEEINTGHMSFDEQDVYLAMMRKISALLAEKGVTMSVNQWHSVMHADLGKTLRPEQNFRPMVDVEGNEAKLCVCPLCGEWQKYIARLYARYAELEPSILWVEDDFRLHNHEPLWWGGCFCDEHMKLYSARGQAADAGRISGRRAVSRRAASLSEDMAGCEPRDDAQRRRSHRIGGARCVKAGEGGPHELGSAHPRRRGARLACIAAHACGRTPACGPCASARISGKFPVELSARIQYGVYAHPCNAPIGDRGIPGAGKLSVLIVFEIPPVHAFPVAERTAAGSGGHHHRLV
ncbi:MAG: hypothetical protein ACLVJ8_04160 [Ruthenibacterium lactatiformans]